MTEGLPGSFAYEQCDVPAGMSLAQWQARRAQASQRRAQVASGLVAAVATLAPVLMSFRGLRPR